MSFKQKITKRLIKKLPGFLIKSAKNGYLSIEFKIAKPFIKKTIKRKLQNLFSFKRNKSKWIHDEPVDSTIFTSVNIYDLDDNNQH